MIKSHDIPEKRVLKAVNDLFCTYGKETVGKFKTTLFRVSMALDRHKIDLESIDNINMLYLFFEDLESIENDNVK